jgi:ADP-ribosylglycohydrolase
MAVRQRSTGCLIGQALGDCLGAETEFLSLEAIYRRFPPRGPLEPPGDQARVTDDTQMALWLAEALLQVAPPLTAERLEQPLRRAFVDWSQSPDNNRAPGRTCLRACHNLARGLPWQEAAVPGSKGAGANMRVAPVGLFARAHHLDDETRSSLAQFQAALTHGHPTALAAADLTALAVVLLAEDADPRALPDELQAYAEAQQTVYHTDWMGDLWQRPADVDSPQEYIARGWRECLTALGRLDAALSLPDRDADPCAVTGQGWVAEEALATGLLCFLLFKDDPVAAIRRAAASSGDSDTIASLTGAFAGAYHGLDGWPPKWVARIEYRDRLLAVGSAWD